MDKKYYVPFKKTEFVDLMSFFETNDCSVRALATSTGMSYEQAWNICKKYGRPYGKGMHTPNLSMMLKDLGFEKIELRTIRTQSNYYVSGSYEAHNTTLGRFIEENPVGRFYVRVDRHVLAIVNGVAYDHKQWGKRKIVHDAWRKI